VSARPAFSLPDFPLPGRVLGWLPPSLRHLAGWWWHELLRRLPDRWVGGPIVRLEIRPDDDGFRLTALDSDGRPTLDRMLTVGEPAPALNWHWQPILCLSGERVLLRRFTLPAGVEGDLRAVMALELDRRTPLRADQAFFHAESHRLADDPAQIAVRLIVLPRASVQGHLDRLAAVGLAPAAIQVALGIDDRVLVPTDQPPPDGPGRFLARRIGFGLAGLAVLTLMALAELGWRQHGLESRLAESAGRAAAVRAEADDIDRTRHLLFHPVLLKQQSPSALVVLEVLSRIIPDGTWLTEYRFVDDTVTLTGVTNDSSALLSIVEQSPHFSSAQFRAAVVGDPAGGDRFELTAKVVPHAAP
jgi:general secretion pathway protein L